MAREISLSYGFDTERPYGPQADAEAGREFRKRQLAFIGFMNETFDREEIPRTHFILTDYLQRCRGAAGDMLLRGIYRKGHGLQEIQQHSHTHGVMSALQGVNKDPMTPEAYIADLATASDLMVDILDIRPTGLRTPYGYPHDLSDRRDILEGMRSIGLTYVSADLGDKSTLVGAMTPERQPHTYAHAGFPDIVEVPAHGVQDVMFLPEKQAQLKFMPPKADALEHYTDVLEEANLIGGTRVNVALCLHPWAVMEWDPTLEKLVALAGRARDKGVRLKTYGQVADGVRPA